MRNEIIADSCRVCLTKTKKLRSLYKPIDEGDEPPNKMLLFITGIKVEELEEYEMLPKNICKNCELSLSMAFEFRENAIKTQEIILEYMKELYETESNEKTKINKFEDMNLEALDCAESLEDDTNNLNSVQHKYSLENDEELNDTANCVDNYEANDDPSEEESYDQQEDFDTSSAQGYKYPDNINNNYFDDQAESNEGEDDIEEHERSVKDDQEHIEYIEEHFEIVPIEEEICTLDQKNFTETNSTKPKRKKLSKICIKNNAKITDINLIQTMKLIPRRGRKPAKNSDQNGHICDICGNVFSKRGRMMEHRQRHDKECRYCCEICDKKFLTRELLRKHMFSHSGGKPFKCQYCSRTFYYESVRKAHEAVHKGLRPFICDVCGKGFSYAHALKKHNLIHAEIKLYRCEYCNKDFRLQHHMKQHELTKLHQNAVRFAKSTNISMDECGNIKEQVLDENILFIDEVADN